jgi:RNA polymerase sigma-70 factor (ECF subfamily)
MAGFREFFQSSWEPCLKAVVVSMGDVRLAEDQVAEAFARAWSSWSTVSRHPAPRAWVVRTALNAGASWWRKRSRERPLENYDVRVDDEPVGGLDAALLRTLRRLPARQREVVVLRILLDLDIESTAQHLGIAPGTVRAHLSRALSTLRTQLPDTITTEAQPCRTTSS